MSNKSFKASCSIKPLKATERRGTQEECIEKSQIRYYGLHRINRELLEEKLNPVKKVSKAEQLKYSIYRLQGVKVHIARVKEHLAAAKKTENKERIKKLTKTLDTLIKDYNDNMPIAVDRYREKEKMKKLKEMEIKKLNELREMKLEEIRQQKLSEIRERKLADKQKKKKLEQKNNEKSKEKSNKPNKSNKSKNKK